ncbi:MAG: cupin domain-containing protein [Thermoplasmata archaeon]
MVIRQQRAEPWGESSPGVRVHRVLQSAQADLNLYRIEPGCLIPSHDHPEAHVGVVLDGGGLSRWSGELHRLVAGEGYRVPPGVFHEFESDPIGTTVILEAEVHAAVAPAPPTGRDLLGPHALAAYLERPALPRAPPPRTRRGPARATK